MIALGGTEKSAGCIGRFPWHLANQYSKAHDFVILLQTNGDLSVMFFGALVLPCVFHSPCQIETAMRGSCRKDVGTPA